MYHIDQISNEISALSAKGFSELGFKEREHLQEWIAKCPESLGEELLIIQKEFDGFDETRERLDLLALDKQGNLVVIENKLDDSGRDVVWQALKYASYCSSLSKTQIAEIFQKHLDRDGSKGNARELICEFLETDEFDEVILNDGNHQRVLLVAARFRREVTSTVLWLLTHGVQLQCFKATVFTHREDVLLNLEQIIPTPESADFMVGISAKEKEQQTVVRTRNNSETLRLAFWPQVLEALADAGVRLFQNVNPTKDHWLSAGSGLSGVPFQMIFAKKEVRVQINFDRSSQEENKQLFDWCVERRQEIEEQFGSALKWQRLDDKKSSKISFRKGVDGFNREEWPGMIKWLGEHIQKLEATFGPVIPKLAREIRGNKREL